MHVIKKKLLFNVCLVGQMNYGHFVPWTFRTQDDSYPGWTIHTQRFGHFVPKVWTIRTQGLDISYPRAERFVPKGWTFVPNAVLIFCIWFGIFASKIVRFIQPIECWWIRTHFFYSFPILDLVFYTCIYTSMYDFSRISHWKSYDMNGLVQTEWNILEWL